MKRSLTKIWWNETEGRPHSLWRVAIFLAVAAGIANPLVIALDSTDNRLLESSLINLAVAVGFVIALMTVARFLEKRPTADYGLTLSGRAWKELAIGTGVGAVAMAALILGLHLTTDLRIVDSFYSAIDGVGFGWTFGGQLVRYLSGAVFEEIVMRGFALITLAEFLRGMKLSSHRATSLAWGATSAMFGLMHFANDHATVIGLINLVWLGVAFGLPMVMTGRLSMAIGLHLGWNVCMNCIFGLPNGGKAPVASLWRCEASGPELLTGGAFGPEGSVLGLIAVLIMGGLTLLVLRRGAASTN